MRVNLLSVFSCVLVVAGSAGVASAQTSPWNMSVSGVVVQYDLSGTGNAPGVAVRATRDLTRHVVLEAGGLLAWPEQQTGGSTIVVPEAQVQYRWNIGRFSPYVGGGGGMVIERSFSSDLDPTFSLGGGTLVRLTERVGLRGELRVRTIGTDYGASTAEWSIGMAWRLPRL